jgi:integrase
VVRAVAVDEVARMLQRCDRRTGTGRRDVAILTVLARLGSRRGEVAALSVDDINWHTGELVVTGKGSRRELAAGRRGRGDRRLLSWRSPPQHRDRRLARLTTGCLTLVTGIPVPHTAKPPWWPSWVPHDIETPHI